MKYKKIRGIVIKSIDYLESDKLVTILSFEKGSVTVKARGVRKKGAKLTYGTQQFFCGDFECVESHGRLILTGVSRVYDFSKIAEDIDRYYAACHYADIASSVIMEEHPDEEMLRMLLNTLHILAKGMVDVNMLTSVFEIRTAVLAGFAPVMNECVLCGSTDKKMNFSFEHGGMVCCMAGVKIDRYTIELIEKLSECDMKEMFSLSVPKTSFRIVGKISRRYIETVLDREFKTLEYMNNE